MAIVVFVASGIIPMWSPVGNNLKLYSPPFDKLFYMLAFKITPLKP